jgi:hypothetical protein
MTPTIRTEWARQIACHAKSGKLTRLIERAEIWLANVGGF